VISQVSSPGLVPRWGTLRAVDTNFAVPMMTAPILSSLFVRPMVLHHPPQFVVVQQTPIAPQILHKGLVTLLRVTQVPVSYHRTLPTPENTRPVIETRIAHLLILLVFRWQVQPLKASSLPFVNFAGMMLIAFFTIVLCASTPQSLIGWA